MGGSAGIRSRGDPARIHRSSSRQGLNAMSESGPRKSSGELPRNSPGENLFILRDVTVRIPVGGEIGPIVWNLPRSGRIALSCAAEGQWETLTGLFSGVLRPSGGVLVEPETVRVQSDVHILDTLNLNQSIGDYLNSPDVPSHVWLENRRRSLWMLIDLLGISPHMTRSPLKMESEAVRKKFWAFRFLISRAELLMGREIFDVSDDCIRDAIAKRWNDLPGTLIAGKGNWPLPGALTGRARISREGRFEYETVPVDLPGEEGIASEKNG